MTPYEKARATQQRHITAVKERRDQEAKEDVAWLMSTQRGRRCLYTLFNIGLMPYEKFQESQRLTDYLLGMEAATIAVSTLCQDGDVDSYLLMMKEGSQRALADKGEE